MEGHVIMKKNGVERWVPEARVEAKKAEGFEVVTLQPEARPEQAHPAARQVRATASTVRGAMEE